MRITCLLNVSALCGALTLASALSGFSASVAADEYRLQPGDSIAVTVWKEEDLSREVLVRPDGGISFPLAGDIQAAGMTVTELTSAISGEISEYIPEPVVTVSVQQALGNRIFVIGKVNNPGTFALSSNVDVMQALALAGGMNTFAAARRIQILRREGDEQRSIPFDYRAVEKGEGLEQNILLKSGDVVVVP
ncbi:MAG: polysaccharide biosynthesis/export family protein [Pseudomonadota bacterium]